MHRAAVRLSPFVLAAVVLLGPAGPPARGQDPFQSPECAAADKAPGAAAAKGKAAAKEPERVVKSNEEWQKILSPEQYLVTRLKATEPAFSGKYATGHYKGTFLCVCCGAKLFNADHKFDSGTGWPSFDRPASAKAIASAWDYSEAEPRVEVTCSRCGAHLGHVFQDGPTPTGLRYCINSIAIKLDSEAKSSTTSKPGRTTSARSRARSRPSVKQARTPSGSD